MPTLADYLRGHISSHDMRPEGRELRALERHACGLFDLYQADTCRLRDLMELAATLLPSTVPRATVKGGLGDFQRRLSEWTGGLSERLRDVDDVAFAGGACTAAVCDCPHGDVDIFFTGGLERAREALEQIYTSVATQQLQRFGPKGRILVTRSKHAVTLFLVEPECAGPSLIQIVLSCCKSVSELLKDFDVDRHAFNPRVWGAPKILDLQLLLRVRA